MALPSTYVADFHNLSDIRKMKYSELGRTGMRISQLSFGAAEFSSVYGEYTIENCKQTLEKALKSGINYIDTAYWYGQNTSQEILGKCLKDIPRQAYYLGTKVGRYELDPTKMFDFSAEKTRWCLENNLKTLGLDYIDVIQIHDVEFAPSVEYLIENTLPVLEEARQKGIVKYIGITAYTVSVLEELVKKSNIKIDMILSYCRFNLFDDSLKKYIPFFNEKNVGIINAAGLGMGLLSNRGPQPWHIAQTEIKTACDKARTYCKENNVELARLALSFLFEDPDVVAHLVGMNTVQLFDANLDVLLNGITEKEKNILAYICKEFFSNLTVRHWEGVELEMFKSSSLNIQFAGSVK